MDLFEKREIRPMLIGEETKPFDDPQYLFELKLDGERCVAYLDPRTGTDLRNKRNVKLLPKFPELIELHKSVKARCILDGELIVTGRDGKPVFQSVQRRSLLTDPRRIEWEAMHSPASFVAFDILYYRDHEATDLPLTQRKALLSKVVKEETARFAVARTVDKHGSALFEAAKAQQLEGVVAKRKDSLYMEGKRTTSWKKIKLYIDDDFIVCGWISKGKHMASLILGQYAPNGELAYTGHVTLGVSGRDFERIREQEAVPCPPFAPPSGHGNDRAVWIRPELVCTVKCMERTKNGGMRQPVFKGLRMDKRPEECISFIP